MMRMRVPVVLSRGGRGVINHYVHEDANSIHIDTAEEKPIRSLTFLRNRINEPSVRYHMNTVNRLDKQGEC